MTSGLCFLLSKWRNVVNISGKSQNVHLLFSYIVQSCRATTIRLNGNNFDSNFIVKVIFQACQLSELAAFPCLTIHMSQIQYICVFLGQNRTF